MSAPVTSKNLYEILGNTHDEDSDKEPEPPVKVADKSLNRSSKRNAPDVAPGGRVHEAPATGGSRRGGAGGSEGAFRDRNAGSSNNRGKSTDDGVRQDRHAHRATEGGRSGRGRGIRGRDRGRVDDRHSQSGKTDSDKQVSQGWGATKGDSEWNDEKAGEAIAKSEEKDGWGANAEAPVNADGETLKSDENAAPAAEPEPEDNTKSYAEYMAEKAQQKMNELGLLEARKPNEGKQDKQWAKAKPLQKEEEDTYIAGAGAKAKRERQRKEKTTLDIDQRFVEPTESRGGREGGSRGRGGREGGERSRGGRGRGEGRGEHRGGDRGGRGRGGERGAFRGGRGGAGGSGRGGAQVNVQDTNAFPSLGGS